MTLRRFARALGTAFLLGTVAASAAGARGELPRTHGALLDSVAGIVAADLLQDLPAARGRAVWIATPLAGDTLSLVTQRIVERLRGVGREVRLLSAPPSDPSQDSVDSTALHLVLTIGASGVSYVRTRHKFPWGVRGYERLATLRVSGRLLDPATHDVLWARSATAQLADLVARRDVGYAASGSGGLNPPAPRGSGFRFLEPLIVAGVVTGLVVLFYSNRN